MGNNTSALESAWEQPQPVQRMQLCLDCMHGGCLVSAIGCDSTATVQPPSALALCPCPLATWFRVWVRRSDPCLCLVFVPCRVPTTPGTPTRTASLAVTVSQPRLLVPVSQPLTVVWLQDTTSTLLPTRPCLASSVSWWRQGPCVRPWKPDCWVSDNWSLRAATACLSSSAVCCAVSVHTACSGSAKLVMYADSACVFYVFS